MWVHHIHHVHHLHHIHHVYVKVDIVHLVHHIHHVHQVGREEKVDLSMWADHRHKMLFVLDGLDECSHPDAEVR